MPKLNLKSTKARVSRDSVLFIAGLAGIAYETLGQHAERPTLLILFAAMVGLPAFLRTDEAKTPPPFPPAPEVPPAAKDGDLP